MERSANSQAEKALAFRRLHERDRAFVIPNPFDVGTARLLAHVGFEALATTSAGFAFTRGRPDNSVARDETMAHCSAIVAATGLPVSGDLGKGFGDAPEDVAETIRRAGAAGLVGGSIEDASLDPDAPIYSKAQAAERIHAAVEAARSLPFHFTLTARAENFLWGRPDLEDTIDRLCAYEAAGADVLYAPGITSEADIAAVVAAVKRPVNVLAGIAGSRLDGAQLSALGVKRISVGSGLSRAAFDAVARGARELLDRGTLSFGRDAITFGEIDALFAEWR